MNHSFDWDILVLVVTLRHLLVRKTNSNTGVKNLFQAKKPKMDQLFSLQQCFFGSLLSRCELYFVVAKKNLVKDKPTPIREWRFSYTATESTTVSETSSFHSPWKAPFSISLPYSKYKTESQNSLGWKECSKTVLSLRQGGKAFIDDCPTPPQCDMDTQGPNCFDLFLTWELWQ